MEPPARAPGATFAPEDGDLLTLYLGPKIAGEPLPSATAPYIHDRDVYAAEPPALVSGLLHASVARNGREISDKWYFYTSVRAKSGRDSRRCRAVAGGAGTWHSEKPRQEIINQEEGRVVGYRQSFTYEPKNGWLMTEYTLVGQEAGRGEDMPVLCKIYRSPHAAAGQSSSKSISASKKRKAAVERSAAGCGSSGRVRRRLQFPLPPPTPSSCPVVAPAGSEFLIPIEAQAEKKAEDEFLLPIEAQAEKKAEHEFLVTIESQAEQETEELQEMLARGEKEAEEEFQCGFFVPIESQAEQEKDQLRGFQTQQELPAWTEKKAEQSQGEFLVPIYSQAAEQETEQLRGFERQQEPLAPMASSRRASLISRLPMAVRYAFAGALASIGHPFEDWATEDEINSHYGDASPLMGGFSSPYDSTCELNCSCGFPPSTLNSYSTTLPRQYWDTPQNPHGIYASTLPWNGNFLSAHQSTPGCY